MSYILDDSSKGKIANASKVDRYNLNYFLEDNGEKFYSIPREIGGTGVPKSPKTRYEKLKTGIKGLSTKVVETPRGSIDIAKKLQRKIGIVSFKRSA